MICEKNYNRTITDLLLVSRAMKVGDGAATIVF